MPTMRFLAGILAAKVTSLPSTLFSTKPPCSFKISSAPLVAFLTSTLSRVIEPFLINFRSTDFMEPLPDDSAEEYAGDAAGAKF